MQLDGVQFQYSPQTDPVLCIDRLTVRAGEFVSLLGTSGSGKSTLLRVIAGLLKPSTGRLERSESMADRIGFVFQNANLVPWRTAEQNLLLPGELGPKPAGVPHVPIEDLVRLVGLQVEDLPKRPAELSGGMQMRLALARALSQSPALLMMDEPFGAVDDVLRMQLEERVRRIHEARSLTTVLVTHNIGEAVFMSDRVLVLGGRPAHICHDVSIDLGSQRNQTTRTSNAYYDYVSAVTAAFQAAADQSISGGVALDVEGEPQSASLPHQNESKGRRVERTG